MTIKIRIENVYSADKPVVEVAVLGKYGDHDWREAQQSTKIPPLEIREFYIHGGQRLIVKETPS